MDFSSLRNPQIPSDRERMFEKVVTPSDVGKLNRLVIPKQHAEKFFPLDSAGGEKGLLLNFEESRSSGKSWRFRYSYWSSSQSYVITKGWSRFVKDKKLDAGDVVSFSRSTLSSPNSDPRLYIDWSRRRRLPIASSSTLPNFHHGFSINVNPPPWCFNYNFPLQVGPILPPPTHRDLGGLGGNYGVIRGNCQAGSWAGTGTTGVGPVAPPVVNKRLRLFGVNMDCTQEEEGGVLDRIPSSSSSGGTTTINFLGKGKSTLDFEL